jgi:hypothetical protein
MVMALRNERRQKARRPTDVAERFIARKVEPIGPVIARSPRAVNRPSSTAVSRAFEDQKLTPVSRIFAGLSWPGLASRPAASAEGRLAGTVVGVLGLIMKLLSRRACPSMP